ncbi:hypothetical protein [Phaeobacter sp.]|uniref:hypothetical protein n=1 Tax=Phaeobacter sp. TaxID=1902409 RepID=UPI0025D16648|nr:hypothetical protein [Phaeobacter sp.]
MTDQVPFSAMPQALGFYSIGLRPVAPRTLERFLHENDVPALDLRAGIRGFGLLDRPVAESRALLRRLHRKAPLRMIASDVDLGDIFAPERHDEARDSILALDALLSDVPQCPIRLLGRYVPQPAEIECLQERIAFWPRRGLLLELHDPDWFHPNRAAPWRLCAAWPELRVLLDSDQIAQAMARHGTSPVAASLAEMREHVGMVHLCDPGDGLDQNATNMIAQIIFSQKQSGLPVPVGFEFTGLHRTIVHSARAYANARAHWQSLLAVIHFA